MREFIYPSASFRDDCRSAIASERAMAIRVAAGNKVAPVSRYMARITLASKQPGLLISVIDNVRIADFVMGVADALLADWRFSYTAAQDSLLIRVEPPDRGAFPPSQP